MSAPTPASNPLAAESSLRLTLRPSRWLWHYQWVLHVLVAVLVGWALWPWGWGARFGALAVCVLLLWHLRYRYRGRACEAGELAFDRGLWTWHSKGEIRSLALAGELLVWPWLIILPFRETTGPRRWHLVLLPDSADADDLRRLRVLLFSRAWRRPAS